MCIDKKTHPSQNKQNISLNAKVRLWQMNHSVSGEIYLQLNTGIRVIFLFHTEQRF